jgi:hypothetical protein
LCTTAIQFESLVDIRIQERNDANKKWTGLPVIRVFDKETDCKFVLAFAISSSIWPSEANTDFVVFCFFNPPKQSNSEHYRSIAMLIRDAYQEDPFFEPGRSKEKELTFGFVNVRSVNKEQSPIWSCAFLTNIILASGTGTCEIPLRTLINSRLQVDKATKVFQESLKEDKIRVEFPSMYTVVSDWIKSFFLFLT